MNHQLQHRLILALLLPALLLLPAGVAFGQNPDSSEPQSAKGQSSTAQPPPPVPVSNVAPAPVFKPLTVGQKFKYAAQRGFGPVALLTSFAAGGYQQYFDQNHGYGQGAEGYFSRVGSRYARTATRQVLGSFVLASIFRQDPRYLPSGKTSTKARLGYALSRVVVTRGDNGRAQFNISGVGGIMGSALISKTWHKPPDDTWRRAGERGGVSLGMEALWNVFREFWPDIRRKLRGH